MQLSYREDRRSRRFKGIGRLSRIRKVMQAVEADLWGRCPPPDHNTFWKTGPRSDHRRSNDAYHPAHGSLSGPYVAAADPICSPEEGWIADTQGRASARWLLVIPRLVRP